MVATNKSRKKKIIVGKGYSEDIELIEANSNQPKAKPNNNKNNTNASTLTNASIPIINPKSTADKYKKFINFKF